MDVDHPRVLLWSFAAAGAVALLVAASTSGAAFGLYNPGWDGASGLRSQADAAGAEATVVSDVSAYRTAPANRTVAVVLSPDRRYSDAEAARLRSFVRRGGTLVVAEDFGPHGNSLLAALGVEARVDGRLLRDERYHHRSPAMPVARNVSNRSLVGGTSGLTLNHGTVVRPNGASVLVRSSGYAYLDENRNGSLDPDEGLDSYPVATVEPVGEGRVVVVSDPSVAINAMLERPGNRRFVRGLFAGADRVLLDYSHAGRLPPLSAALLAVRGSPPLQLLVGVVAVVGLAAWIRRPGVPGRVRTAVERVRGRGGVAEPPVAGEDALVVSAPDEDALVVSAPDEDALVASVAERHPEWDRERVRRVVRAVRRRPSD
jgi:hypothetical protein